jgi:hypothetical protein
MTNPNPNPQHVRRWMEDNGFVKIGSVYNHPEDGYANNISENEATFFYRLAKKMELKAQTNAVAWSVGVVDELHMESNQESETDKLYKGVKNTLRDLYKAQVGIDPAPSYPTHVALTKEEGETE